MFFSFFQHCIKTQTLVNKNLLRQIKAMMDSQYEGGGEAFGGGAGAISTLVYKNEKQTNLYWTNALIFYIIDQSVSQLYESLIEQCMKQFHTQTVINWVNIKNLNDWELPRCQVTFIQQKNSQPYSTIGRLDKGTISLPLLDDTDYKLKDKQQIAEMENFGLNLILHLMCHVIGLHDQNHRIDDESTFQPLKLNDITLHGEFDVQSIMYMPTKNDCFRGMMMRQLTGFSQKDIQLIDFLYGDQVPCINKVQVFKDLQYLDKNNQKLIRKYYPDYSFKCITCLKNEKQTLKKLYHDDEVDFSYIMCHYCTVKCHKGHQLKVVDLREYQLKNPSQKKISEEKQKIQMSNTECDFRCSCLECLQLDEIEFFDGRQYQGGIRNGKMHGMGELFDKQGNVEYLGNFYEGFQLGQGEYFFPDGTKYEGEFYNDQMQGKGQLRNQQGNVVYDGQFFNNQYNGKAVFVYQEGSILKGKAYDGHFYGPCKIINDLTGMLIYKGEMKKDMLDGKGAYENQIGERYIGEFKQDKLHGVGKIYGPFTNPIVDVQSDQLMVAGSFQKGLFHGLAKDFTDPQFHTIQNFNQGNLVEEIKYLKNNSQY